MKKATGIVRRIDDLGRIVIPKEIRRTMRIRQGDQLEIYTTDEGEVMLKKYSILEELADTAELLAESVNKACGMTMVITDNDTVVACAGISKTDILKHIVSQEFRNVTDSRQLYIWLSKDRKIPVNSRQDKYFVKTGMPILCDGDIIGSVAAIEINNSLSEPTETEIQIVKTLAVYLGKQLELES